MINLKHLFHMRYNIIYKFFGHCIEISIGDKKKIKSWKGKWFKSTVHFQKSSESIPYNISVMLQQTLAIEQITSLRSAQIEQLQALFIVSHFHTNRFDTENLKVGENVDARDRWGKWCEARIEYIKLVDERLTDEIVILIN